VEKNDYLKRLSGKAIAVVGLGYIGSRLASYLASKQAGIGFDLYLVGRANIEILRSRPFDYVFNCAGNTGDFRRFPLETVESNVGLTASILANSEIREALVCLSSTRIYGFTADHQRVFAETDALPNHLPGLDALYDDTKKLMESMLLSTVRDYRKISVRLSNIYGRYSSDDLDDSTFLKLMLRHAREKESLSVDQNLLSTKDYIFVDDALDGILRAGILSERDEVYNVCAGKSYSIRDWADVLGLRVESNCDGPRLYSRVSNQKAQNDLGFECCVDLEDLERKLIVDYE
jgi:nucleoside-diphosphate-sugar epimerase